MEGRGWRVESGGLRVEGGGLRVEGGGWRVEGGGRSLSANESVVTRGRDPDPAVPAESPSVT